MSDEIYVPGIPSSVNKEYDMNAPGDMDGLLDIDPSKGIGNEVVRARAGLDGDWVASKVTQHVNWDDPDTYDSDISSVLWDTDGGWDDAILLDD